HLFDRSEEKSGRSETRTMEWDDEKLAAIIGETRLAQVKEELELLDMAGEEFDAERFRSGDITPVFFGSALTNYGVEPFLTAFGELAPRPVGRHSTDGVIPPERERFSGFVFKIQANMDKNHRDR